jgi:hypothetical protein
MRPPSDTELSAWIARRWDGHRPGFSHAYLCELFAEEKQYEATQRAASAEARRLDDLAKRIATLEQQVRRLPKAVGLALGKTADQLRAERAAVPDVTDLARRLDQIEQRPDGMQYRGTWNAGTDYPPSSVVSRAGAAWCAVDLAMAGEIPGKSERWRMIAKSDVADLRKVVREELKREPTLR